MPLISFIEKHFSLVEVENAEYIIKWLSFFFKNHLVKDFSPSLKKDSVLFRKDHSNLKILVA